MKKMINLEQFTKDDFSCLISWVDNEETLIQFAGTIFSFPLTHQQPEIYLVDKNRNAYKVVNAEDRTTVVHAEIYTLHDGVARLCRIIIGNPEFRGREIGQKIVNELLDISFNNCGAASASLNVFDWNIPAIRCYEKSGFVLNKDNTKTTIVKDKVWTSVNMKITKIAWEKLQRQA